LPVCFVEQPVKQAPCPGRAAVPLSAQVQDRPLFVSLQFCCQKTHNGGLAAAERSEQTDRERLRRAADNVYEFTAYGLVIEAILIV
jgi:hypothetical protein